MSVAAPKGRGRGRGRGKPDPSQVTAPGECPQPSQPVSVGTPAQPVSVGTPATKVVSPRRNQGRGRGRGQPVVQPTEQTVELPIIDSNEAVPKLTFDSDGKPINPWTAKIKNQLEPMARKDYGKEGRPIDLYTNFYEIKHNSNMSIHQYDIVLDIPEKLLKSNKMLGIDIFNKMVQEYRDQYFQGIYPVFDGSRIMYTNKEIQPDKMLKLPVTYEGRDFRQGCIDISITPTKQKINFKDIDELYQKMKTDLPYDVFSCADIILGFMPKMSYVSYGRNYFPRGQTVSDLGNGIQLWSGSVMAVKPGQWKLLLNVDEKHTAFYKEQGLREFIACVLPNKKGAFSSGDVRKLNEHLKGLRVQVCHNGYPRKHRIVGITEQPASKMLITDNKSGEKITVAEYFRREKEQPLQSPDLPCIQVEPRNRDIFLPVELCTIVEGQRCIRSLTDKQIAEIIKTSAKKPDIKKRTIDSSASKLIESGAELAQRYGIEIDDTPLKIKGRVLPPPNLLYANTRAPVKPAHGAWRGSRMSKGTHLQNWGIICFAPKNRFDPQKFCQGLQGEGSKMGVKIENPLHVRFVNEREFANEVGMAKNKFPNLQYLFIILPQPNNPGLYGQVKEAEANYGLLTQCITMDTFTKKFKPQTLGNILLKTNTKLGGVNWELSYDLSPLAKQMGNFVFGEPVMIIGADVTHWTKEDNRPSIAGVVCTLDRYCSKYASHIKLQPRRINRVSTEIIQDFKFIFKDLLIKFRNHNGRKPGKILYYRDGVSQGQFIQTLTKEMSAIQEACKELEEGWQPKITYINAQKRHHTRLYCANTRDADRSGNVPAGTVIDREITNPIHFDFYLNSHAGIQGTNRACHYTVLWDDSDMSPDMIQLLTFYLCHVYARCSRSVSYPAPTYYAHLLCARARSMLSSMRINWFDTSKPPNIMDIEEKLTQHRDLQNISYFV